MSMEEKTAAGALVPELYRELHAIACSHHAFQSPVHTLQPTALLHEAYLRLAGTDATAIGSRTHFLSLASRVMRQVLVDHARARRAAKRDRDPADRITLDDLGSGEPSETVDLMALEEALTELARLNPEKARLIELRFFGGLGEAEAAEAMGISRSSATRQWRMARAWLMRRLTQASG